MRESSYFTSIYSRMRLFYTKPEISGELVSITDPKKVRHANVVRVRRGDHIGVQYQTGAEMTRHMMQVTDVSSSCIQGHIVQTEKKHISQRGVGIIVGMLHEFDRVCHIVQKCTELGVHEIVFRGSERAQVQQLSVKKMSKLCKISIQSVEQSNGRVVPNIRWIDSFDQMGDVRCVIFDFDGKEMSELSGEDLIGPSQEMVYGLVGPEGHFGPNDMQAIAPYIATSVTLGASILRSDTASIVGSFLLLQVVSR